MASDNLDKNENKTTASSELQIVCENGLEH